jgi:integrase
MPRKHQRKRVEPGLYKEGSTYWACATSPGTRAARWKKLGAIGVQQARRERDVFAYQLKSGQLPKTARRILVKDVANEWFSQLDELESAGEIAPRTVSSYKDGITLHVLPTFRSRPLSSIDADDLTAWHERQRRSGAATWSIRARWVALRGLLTYATREAYIPSNPCDALTRRERPKPGRPKTRYLTEAEIQRILNRGDSGTKAINALLIFSGLRASELLGLIWQDIDFEHQLIHVTHQMSRKGKRAPLKTEAAKREVILMDELARLLRRRKLAAPFSGLEDLVIANGIGNTLGYTRLRGAFATAAEAADVADASPHTCRHTFASILIAGGASVEFVSDQLGHASTKTTWDIYVHLFRARDQALTAKQELDAAFGRILRAAGEEPSDD